MDIPAETVSQSIPELTSCSVLAEQTQQRRGSVPPDQPEAIVVPAEWQLATLAG